MRLIRYSYPATLTPSVGTFSRSPWSGFEAEIDRLFENALDGLGDRTTASRCPVDLYEDKDNTYVRAELPGVSRDDISVEVVDGYLTINATRKTPGAEGEESFGFQRSLAIPDDVETDKVAAAYENGVLTVTLPKREAAKPKKITISVK